MRVELKKILIIVIFFYLNLALAEGIDPLSDLYQRTYHISIKDNYLFASSTAGLTIYRVDKRDAIQISSLVIENSGTSSIIEGNYLYLFAGNSGVYKIDIKNPRSPVILKNIRLPGSAINGDIYKNNIIVSLGSAGFSILKKDTLEPVKYVETASYCSSVKVLDSNLFVSTENDGLFVYRLHNSNLKLENKIPLARRVRDIIKMDNMIFLADDTDGIITLRSDKNGFTRHRYKTSDTARGVAVYKDYLFVADGNTGLLIFKITPDGLLKHIKDFNTGYSANKVIIKDDLLIISNDAMGVMILKVDEIVPSIR